MDRKANQSWAGSLFTVGVGGGGLKRSESQLILEELFRNNNMRDVFAADADDQLLIDESDHPFGHGLCSAADLPIHFGKSEMMQYSPWVKDFTPNYSPAVDSPLSVLSSPNSNCAKPNVKGGENKVTTATSGSSNNEQSEEGEAEPDGNWQCEESADPADIRRNKRKRSNRDSARRSRRRKQAHLAELEQQVEKIRGENATLLEQLMDADQQYKDATTNNRVLKSDVAALRANVELAEDMVARGPLTSSSLTNLLKNHLSIFEEPSSYIPYPCRSTGNFITNHHRNHRDSPLAVPPTTGLENMENFHANFNNNSMMSSVSENWP